jgi:hypothetical protein
MEESMSDKKYFGGFNNLEDIAREFADEPYNRKRKIPENLPTEEQIIFAAYEGGSYEGAAIVVYEKDGKLYEVNGSHCSCYGLEGQWAPEETTREALAMRKLASYDYEKDTRTRFHELFGGTDG